MEPKIALRRVLFLKNLDEDVIDEIARMGQVRTFQKGESIFLENTRCLGLIVVLTGGVKIYKTNSHGREMTLGFESPGASVAELPLFDGGNYPASAEAALEETTLLIVARDQFQRLMAMHPQIAEQAMPALAIRMRKHVQMIENQTLRTVRGRLAGYLWHAARGRSEFLLEETNEEIAAQIGTVRDVVSRTFGSLKDAGAITLKGRMIKIIDSGNLHRLMEE